MSEVVFEDIVALDVEELDAAMLLELGDISKEGQLVGFKVQFH